MKKHLINHSSSYCLVTLGIYIACIPSHFPDKGLLACFYCLVAAICIAIGKQMREYKDWLLWGLLLGAMVLGLLSLLNLSITGQKNLLANYLSCGAICAMWLFNRAWIRFLLGIILYILALATLSKTAILYLPLLVWILYVKRITD